VRKLGPEELGDLLDQPLVAVLATYRMDGGVLLSPVWHQWREGGFEVVVYAGDIKLQHLRRDPRASVVVYEHEPPYRGLEVRGEARLLQDGTAEAMSSMALRYLGEENGRAYAESISASDTVLVRLEPTHVRGWDFSDDMAQFEGG
jgi:PPOX class probable F420-dependent enzyme